jgi:hypothetical protein
LVGAHEHGVEHYRLEAAFPSFHRLGAKRFTAILVGAPLVRLLNVHAGEVGAFPGSRQLVRKLLKGEILGIRSNIGSASDSDTIKPIGAHKQLKLIRSWNNMN